MEDDYTVHQVALCEFHIYENPDERTDEERIEEMESITNVEDPLDLPEWEVFDEPDYDGESWCRVDTKTRINVAVPPGESVNCFDLINRFLPFEDGYDPAMSSWSGGSVEDFEDPIHLDYDDVE